MVARVNEIRAHLEGLDRQAPAAQGRDQPQSDGGLPHPALGAGDDQASGVMRHVS
jgi:hypothetical protein